MTSMDKYLILYGTIQILKLRYTSNINYNSYSNIGCGLICVLWCGRYSGIGTCWMRSSR